MQQVSLIYLVEISRKQLDLLNQYAINSTDEIQSEVIEIVEWLEQEACGQKKQSVNTETERIDPQAKTLDDLLTPRQIGLATRLARECGFSVDEFSREKFGIALDSLSREAASRLIDELQEIKKERVK